MSTRIRYTSAAGRTLDLLRPGDWHRSIAYGGLSGMIGSVATSVQTAVGVPGQTPVSSQVQKMEGELTLHIVESMGVTVEEAVAEIRREFSPTVHGTMHLDRGRAASPLMTPVRLNGVIAALPGVPEDMADAEVKIPLISDEGLWAHGPAAGTGNVTVTNFGDAFCWPWIEWWGPATVTLPSGTVIMLPWEEGDQPRRVSLDPYTSHEVAFTDGTIDEALSADSGKWRISQGVPEGSDRDYLVSGDAKLWWQIKVLDPWR